MPTSIDRYQGFRRCREYAGLFHPEEGPTRCPAGGRHRPAAIAYALWVGPIQPNQEAGWDECTRCWGIYWPGSSNRGVCPKGGAHRPNGAGYKLDYIP